MRISVQLIVLVFISVLLQLLSFFHGALGLKFSWGWTFAAFTALVAFMRRSGWSFFVAFRVFVAFTGRWGWTFVACTVFLLFMECLGWTFVAFMKRSRWSFFFGGGG